jgi:prolyl 4-hydroxylase
LRAAAERVIVSRTHPAQMRTNVDRGIFTIADVLTQDECQEYIDWSERLGYETAPVSLAAGQILRPDIRNNARVMIDSPERANDIWSRISADVPPIVDGRRAVGLNERLRFYRYGPGQRFAPHTDGCYRRSGGEESLLTLMIYLNGGARGGETRFESASITPAPGLALIFDHYLIHEGARVLEGQKYVLRSDVMFGLAGSGDGGG